MTYHYICDNCGNELNKEYPMGEAVEYFSCEKCGKLMTQNLLKKRVQSHIPEDYKALSEYHSVDYGDDDVIEYKCGDN